MSRFYDTNDLRDGEIRLYLLRNAEANPEKGWLPAYHFEVQTLDGTRVGFCDFRVGQNENTCFNGNLGYTIFPPYRGHHYGAKACRLMLVLAKKHGMDRVIVTCDPENKASARTCEIAGGELWGTVELPEESAMYAAGKRSVLVYRFSL